MSLLAIECPNGHVTYPTHPRCPRCGESPTEEIDLAELTGEIVTWTESTATPPGVREPNPVAIVEFSVGDRSVRVIGQLTGPTVEIGDAVRPVYAEELRDPDRGIREPESQAWDGYRFEPID